MIILEYKALISQNNSLLLYVLNLTFMLSKSLILFAGFLLIISCQNELDISSEDVHSVLSKQMDELILDKIELEQKLFNWNEQSSDFFCKALPLTDYVLAVGFETNQKGKTNLNNYIHQHQKDL